MRKNYFSHLLTGVCAVLLLSTGCVKDKCTSRYTFWEPVYRTKEEVRANIKNNPSREIENPGKIYIRGHFIFLNEVDRGIHIIDNSDRSAPRKIAFIDIPGNMDMAVKGNMLYADFYTDLVAIDITNPHQVVVKKITENVFPERYWGNGFSPNPSFVIADWVRRDTLVETYCGGNGGIFDPLRRADVYVALSNTGAAGGGSPIGIGGSMAGFAIVNNYLYAVSNTSLNVISLVNATDPVFSNRVSLGWGIETIYPFNNRLFIGSNTGMFIYDIANPTSPAPLGTFSHVRSCDPVIADNQHAFVTLRSGNVCDGFTNQLEVLNIANITNPVLVKTYPMTNPHGLAKDGNILIICDGKDGLKFYNSTDVSNLQSLHTISGPDTYDVIALNGWALVVARDGLYQYDFSNINQISLLSKLGVKN